MASNLEVLAAEAQTNSQDDGKQEGITVAIRMRPLNKVEGSRQRIWKVLPKYNSITQTTNTGKPLSERISGRTFFTFDKTFGEDINTTQVYDSVAKGIVSSVVNGLNGTIFAYGQTSSGKTYTMQGSGSIEQGTSGEGGVVHMAAKDIFSLIESQQNRVFLVRASFLEIYNEEVRDLLSNSNQTLPIREDPRRGVFVQSVEEPVTDFESLLRILFYGEKSRAIASTGMNERSSRSHTIFRVTIESREKEPEDDAIDGKGDENKPPATDGAVRVATLNLVDLAGSESVRHTGATGERQKEGGMINQSLLTLSRVIVSLGNSNQGHINFRDSKLTRILQPSLSGNARMAIVCCATPSELYLEETRSTLQFASRAKLVKTNAQVNEVLDDRSIIKRLQQQLAEARRQSTVSGNTEHLKSLENRAEVAGTVAKEAKEKLNRLKASILNTGYLFARKNDATSLEAQNATNINGQKSTLRKRRQSDGGLLVRSKMPMSPLPQQMPPTPKTAIKKQKKSNSIVQMLSPRSELGILREALSSRNESLRSAKQLASKNGSTLKDKDSELEKIKTENTMLKEESLAAQMQLSCHEEQTEALRTNFEEALAAQEAVLLEKELKIVDSAASVQQEMKEKEDLQVAYSIIQANLESLRKQADAERAEAATLQNTLSTQLQELQQRFDAVNQAKVQSDLEIAQHTSEKEEMLAERQEDKKRIHDMKGEIESMTSTIRHYDIERDQTTQRQAQLETLRNQASETNIALERELQTLKTSLACFEKAEKEWKTQMEQSGSDIQVLENNLAIERSRNETLLNDNEVLQTELNDTKTAFSAASKEIESLRTLGQEQNSSFKRAIEEFEAEKKVLEENFFIEKSKTEELLSSNGSLKEKVGKLAGSLDDLKTNLQSAHQSITAQKERYEELKEENCTLTQLCSTHEENTVSLRSELDSLSSSNVILEEGKKVLEEELSSERAKSENWCTENASLKQQVEALAASFNQLSSEVQFKDQTAIAQQESYHKLQDEHNNLKQLCTSKEEAVLSLQSEIDAEKIMRINLEEAKKTVEDSNDSLKDRLEKVQSSLNDLFTKTEQSDSAKDEAYQKLEEEHEGLKDLYANQEESSISLQAQMESLLAEKKVTEAAKIAMETELSNTSQLLCEAQNKVEALVLRIEQSESEVNNKSQKIKEMEKEMDKEMELLGKEKESHETAIAELRSKLEISESQVAELFAQIDASESDHSKLQTEKQNLEQRIASLENDIQLQEEKAESLLIEGITNQESIGILEAEVESVRSQLVSSTDRLGTLALEIEEVREENVELGNRLSTAETEKLELEKELGELTPQKEALEIQVSDLQIQSGQLESRIQENSAEVESLNADIARLEAGLAASEAGKAEIVNQISSVENELNTLRQENLLREERVVALETELNDSQARERQTASENRNIVLEFEELVIAKEELAAQLQDFDTRSRSLQLELEHVTAELDTAIAARQSLQSELEQHAAEKVRLANINESLSENISELKKQIEALEMEQARDNADNLEKVTVLGKQIESLEMQLGATNEKIREMTSEKDAIIKDSSAAYQALQSSLEAAESRMSSLTEEKDELIRKLEYIENQSNSLAESKVALEQTTSDFQSQVDALNTHLEEVKGLLGKESEEKERVSSELEMLKEGMSAKYTKLDEEKEDVESQLRDLEASKRDLETERDNVLQQNEALRFENQEIQNKLDRLTAEKLHVENQIVTLNRELMETTAKSDSMEVSWGESEEKVRSYGEKLDTANSQIEQLKSEKDKLLGELQLQIDTSLREKKELEAQVEELKENVRDVEAHKNAVSEELEKLREDNGDANRQLENVEVDKVEIETRLMSIQNESAAANEQADRLKVTISDLQLTIDSLEDKLERSSAENEECRRQLDDTLKELEALSTGQISMGSQVEAIKCTNDELTAKKLELEQEREILQSENDDLRNRLQEFELDVAKFEKDLESENERSAALQSNIDALEARHQATQTLLGQANRELGTAEINLRHESSLRESLQKSLQEREAERDDAALALKSEYEKNRNLNRVISESLTKEREANLLSEISTLKMSNDEVKQLLASSNESEQRFRKIASSTEKELTLKEAELEDALYRLSQMEEELRLSEISGLNESQMEESQRNLHLQIEELVAEKTLLEKQIEKEREEREAAETDLKKQMGEEQRLLIQEGERHMGELRNRAETLQKSLEDSEAEAYAARQQIEELRDEKKSLEKANTEANRINTELREQVERTESQLSTLQSDLSKAKADCYAQKESTIEMKEKMRKASREQEKASRETEMAKSELSTLTRKLNNLQRVFDEKEEEKRRMASELVKSSESAAMTEAGQAAHAKAIKSKDEEILKLEEKVTLLKKSQKKAEGEYRKLKEKSSASNSSTGKPEIEKLKGDIEKYKDVITKRDERIAILKSKTLTKKATEEIKRIHEENKSLTKECAELTDKVSKLKEQLSSVGSDSSVRAEVGELQFHNDALEKKVRKFAIHCQRLEDERSAMKDTLRSCSHREEFRNDDVDISEAIIWLCDKVSSQDGRSVASDPDLQRVERQNSHLTAEVNRLKRSEEELSEKLDASQQQVERLRSRIKDVDEDNNGTQREMRGQLRFLEQENLQLLNDLKSKKKELQTAREELEMLRINAADTPTLDFGSVDIVNSKTNSKSDKDSKMSENSLSKRGGKRSREHIGDTPSKRATELSKPSKRQLRSRAILGDSTNTGDNENSLHINSRAGTLLPNSSRKKNRTEAPGLGQAAAKTVEEAPGECNQS